ncbi:D-2-hydroxyacid dehydrogenase [Tenacibaculum sp. IB213877]|uniref:D-2-hydroxyacid dehydrogenase n=1 Tax=Tenacibaculum sp. IB213877 TaxID=3097351 RepID=UPI002A5A5602|nr:D-2-hydroxyacid dehydrogenase [Tenacibaculum sp. IB213877]MDY0779545.1 D-2-hydroxyacid dehydrogenase [Tenacibaculum sp. IB213877]
MKILINDGISKSGELLLQESGFEVLNVKVAQNQLENYINDNHIDALLVRSATQVREELIDACPSLKLIGRGGVGMENIDVEYAIDQGLHVVNTPEASAESVAELVFAHLLGMVRNLHQSNREMPLEGDSNFKTLKKLYLGTELRGKTLGIVGMGRVGIAVAKIAIGLGMQVIMTDDSTDEVTVDLEFFDGQKLHFTLASTDINELYQQSDFVTYHIPTQKEYVVTETEFNKMKDGVGIINASRGGIIDEVALINAIDSEKVRFAGLDVFENEPNPEVQLLMNPSLSLSPHIGASTIEAQERIGMELAKKVIELLKDQF